LGKLDEHDGPAMHPSGQVTSVQPIGQSRSHEHAFAHDTVPHAASPRHVRLQLPLSPLPQLMSWHAFVPMQLTLQLVPLHEIE
jgi:hypothetical protein